MSVRNGNRAAVIMAVLCLAGYVYGEDAAKRGAPLPSTNPLADAEVWKTDYDAFLSRLGEILKSQAPDSVPATADGANFLAVQRAGNPIWILVNGDHLTRLQAAINAVFGGKQIVWKGVVTELLDTSNSRGVRVSVSKKKDPINGWDCPDSIYVPLKEGSINLVSNETVVVKGTIPNKAEATSDNVLSGISIRYGASQFAGKKVVGVSLDAGATIESCSPKKK